MKYVRDFFSSSSSKTLPPTLPREGALGQPYQEEKENVAGLRQEGLFSLEDIGEQEKSPRSRKTKETLGPVGKTPTQSKKGTPQQTSKENAVVLAKPFLEMNRKRTGVLTQSDGGRSVEVAKQVTPPLEDSLFYEEGKKRMPADKGDKEGGYEGEGLIFGGFDDEDGDFPPFFGSRPDTPQSEKENQSSPAITRMPSNDIVRTLTPAPGSEREEETETTFPRVEKQSNERPVTSFSSDDVKKELEGLWNRSDKKDGVTTSFALNNSGVQPVRTATPSPGSNAGESNGIDIPSNPRETLEEREEAEPLSLDDAKEKYGEFFNRSESGEKEEFRVGTPMSLFFEKRRHQEANAFEGIPTQKSPPNFTKTVNRYAQNGVYSTTPKLGTGDNKWQRHQQQAANTIPGFDVP